MTNERNLRNKLNCESFHSFLFFADVNTCFTPCFCFFTSSLSRPRFLMQFSFAVKRQHFYTYYNIISPEFLSLCLDLAYFASSLTSFTKCCEPLKISHHRVCLIIKDFLHVQRRITSLLLDCLQPF
jgi:hypothetical protein